MPGWRAGDWQLPNVPTAGKENRKRVIKKIQERFATQIYSEYTVYWYIPGTWYIHKRYDATALNKSLLGA